MSLRMNGALALQILGQSKPEIKHRPVTQSRCGYLTKQVVGLTERSIFDADIMPEETETLSALFPK